MYPMDKPGGGYQEINDPVGPTYLKPDTNIAVPRGTPITSWDSGVITSVIDRGRNLAGLSVTMKLDHPINGMAQYASFNYLGSSSVNVGQTVNKGQEIGIAGSPYGINFALGLGVSPVWGAQCPQCHTKEPLLDPRLILNQLRSSGVLLVPNAAGNVPSVPNPVTDWLNQETQALQTQFKPLTDWITNPVRVIKMITGILLLGLAGVLLIVPNIEKITETAEKVAPFLAA
jgi:hypothetical protein